MEGHGTEDAGDSWAPRVLVAEDAAIQAKLAQKCLEHAACHVLLAQNGNDALALARRERPDIVLLDVEMPGLNGFQVLDSLRSDPETQAIPVVMLTAHAKDVTLFDEWARPTDAFLTKPFSPAHLIDTVQRIARELRAAGDEA